MMGAAIGLGILPARDPAAKQKIEAEVPDSASPTRMCIPDFTLLHAMHDFNSISGKPDPTPNSCPSWDFGRRLSSTECSEKAFFALLLVPAILLGYLVFRTLKPSQIP